MKNILEDYDVIKKLIYDNYEEFYKKVNDETLYYILHTLVYLIELKEIENIELKDQNKLLLKRNSSINNFLSRLGEKGLITGKE